MARQEISEFPLPPMVWKDLVQTLRLPPQQIRIVELILLNHGDKQIAVALHIKLPTLRTYIERIYARLDVHDRLGLLLRLLAMSHRVCRCEP